MIEGFVLDGLPATRYPYLQCNILQIERLCTEAQAISEQLEQAKKGVTALNVFHNRLQNEKIVRVNVQSVKTTASARYAPHRSEGFDLSAVPIGLFVELVTFVPIPYLKTLVADEKTLRYVMEMMKGRPVHPQWGTYYTFLMKVNTEWAQRFSDEVQAQFAAAKAQRHEPMNGLQLNDDLRGGVNSQQSVVRGGHHPLRSTADSIPSTIIDGDQPSSPDRAQTTAQESMYLRVLRAKEREWGAEHETTLDTVMKLGSLYTDEGNISEALRMFSRALSGYAKVEARNSDNHKTREVLRGLEHALYALAEA